MSSEYTITISSVQEGQSKYRRLNHKRYTVTRPPPQHNDAIKSVAEDDKGGNATITRRGRVVKPPQRYQPVEIVTDDYRDSEYDTEEEGSEA